MSGLIPSSITPYIPHVYIVRTSSVRHPSYQAVLHVYSVRPYSVRRPSFQVILLHVYLPLGVRFRHPLLFSYTCTYHPGFDSVFTPFYFPTRVHRPSAVHPSSVLSSCPTRVLCSSVVRVYISTIQHINVSTYSTSSFTFTT